MDVSINEMPGVPDGYSEMLRSFFFWAGHMFGPWARPLLIVSLRAEDKQTFLSLPEYPNLTPENKREIAAVLYNYANYLLFEAGPIKPEERM